MTGRFWSIPTQFNFLDRSRPPEMSQQITIWVKMVEHANQKCKNNVKVTFTVFLHSFYRFSWLFHGFGNILLENLNIYGCVIITVMLSVPHPKTGFTIFFLEFSIFFRSVKSKVKILAIRSFQFLQIWKILKIHLKILTRRAENPVH